NSVLATETALRIPPAPAEALFTALWSVATLSSTWLVRLSTSCFAWSPLLVGGLPSPFTSLVNVFVADLKSSKAFVMLSLVRLPPLREFTVVVTESFQVVTDEQNELAQSWAVSGLLLFPPPAASSTSAASTGRRTSCLAVVEPMVRA